LVIPAPPGWQLGGLSQTPFEQKGVAAAHAAALPHWPHASHVSTALPAHCVALGVHAGVDGHEQGPQLQLASQVCVP
jgi:hypothetical protein